MYIVTKLRNAVGKVFDPIYSTSEIYVKDDIAKPLDGTLDKIAADIDALKGGGSAVTPIAVLPMHLGRLDNNSGAEVSSSNRICSDATPVEVGKTYWMTSDKGVNMYALLYDADEMFVKYKGNIPSGQPIEVTEEGAVYIRFSSLVGEYDLTNEFRLYDTDPAAAPEDPNAGYTKAEADERFSPVVHAHGADEVTFADGETFQQKLDAGTLKGEKGEPGAQGPAGPTNMRVQNGVVQYTTDNGTTWKNAVSVWG